MAQHPSGDAGEMAFVERAQSTPGGSITPRKRSAERSTRFLVLLIFWIITLSYLLCARGNINVIDGIIRYGVTESIILRHSIALPENWPYAFPVRAPDGNRYSNYGLGQPLAQIPFYLVGKALNTLQPIADPGKYCLLVVSFFNCFAAAAACGALYLLIRRLGYSLRTALLTTFLFAFGTILFSQAKDSFEHPSEALFNLLALYSLVSYKTTGRARWILASGLCFGFGIIFREMLLIFLPTLLGFLIYVSWTPPSGRWARILSNLGLFAFALLPFAAFLGWHNWARTGFWLCSSYAATGHLEMFKGSALRGLIGLLFSPGRGLFVYNPILLLSLVALPAFWRKQRAVAIAALGMMASYLLFYCRFYDWGGGLCWGPRYLVVTIPLLLLFAAEFLENHIGAGRRIPRYAQALIALSLLIQLSSVLVNHEVWFHKVALMNEGGAKISVNLSLVNSPLIRQWESLYQVFSDLAQRRPPSHLSFGFWTGLDFWWYSWPPGNANYLRFGGLAVVVFLLALSIIGLRRVLARN